MKYINSFLLVALVLATTSCAKKQIINSGGTTLSANMPIYVQPSTSTITINDTEPNIRGTIIETDPNMQTIYFEFDKYELAEEARTVLKSNADYMKLLDNSMFCVEGHCDERGTVEYNLALGQRRAAAVRQYYKMLGIKSTWIATISYGEEKPAVEGTGEEVWANNRRAETRRMYEKEK